MTETTTDDDMSTRPTAAVRHRRPLRRVLLLAAASVAAAVLVTATGAPGSLARLSSEAVTEGPVVLTAGSADLTVSAIDLPTTALYPGLTVFAAVTVTNSGAVPLALAVAGIAPVPGVRSTDFAAALTFGVGGVDSASTCRAGRAATSWTGTFAAPTPGPVGVDLAVGASRVLCVSVGLTASAPAATQGAPAEAFELRLSGAQE